MVSKLLLLSFLPGTNALVGKHIRDARHHADQALARAEHLLNDALSRTEHLLNQAQSHAAKHQDRIAETLDRTAASLFYLVLLSVLMVVAVKEKPTLRTSDGRIFYLCFSVVLLVFSALVKGPEPLVCGVLFAAFVNVQGMALARQRQPPPPPQPPPGSQAQSEAETE
ncbi:hypothetical protein FN846DRAFT_911278 [Sphaerosporella brunnea]|uniref:Uncharacterized protein n=1 Tax=Sphaerosporella brunnea TaxID=1250544 RepID=A0A5J5EL84_9PEZI|nr:hypothetical protein FN846DRAFT_911278 [Sphaerosporella brunnea]